MFIFPCDISGISEKSVRTLHNFFVIWQCKSEILVLSLFLAKNDRGVFGGRVALAGAGPVIPLAFGGSLSIHLTTFLCYTIRFASVPVTVARQQCVICPVELVICLSVKSKPYATVCYFFCFVTRSEMNWFSEADVILARSPPSFWQFHRASLHSRVGMSITRKHEFTWSTQPPGQTGSVWNKQSDELKSHSQQVQKYSCLIKTRLISRLMWQSCRPITCERRLFVS